MNPVQACVALGDQTVLLLTELLASPCPQRGAFDETQGSRGTAYPRAGMKTCGGPRRDKDHECRVDARTVGQGDADSRMNVGGRARATRASARCAPARTLSILEYRCRNRTRMPSNFHVARCTTARQSWTSHNNILAAMIAW